MTLVKSFHGGGPIQTSGLSLDFRRWEGREGGGESELVINSFLISEGGKEEKEGEK